MSSLNSLTKTAALLLMAVGAIGTTPAFASTMAAAEVSAAISSAKIGNAFSFTYSTDLQKKFDDKYGNREKETLQNSLIKEIYPKLPEGAVKVEIEIKDATTNRPTFEQMSKQTGLSMQSFGIGGASLSGKIYDAEGKVLRQADYKYYGLMDQFTPYKWVWEDANYAISRFAEKLTSNESIPK